MSLKHWRLMGEEPQPATSFCKVEHHCNLHSASEVGPPVHINYLHFFYHFKAHSCAQLYHCKVVLFVAPKCCYQLSKHLQPAVQGLVCLLSVPLPHVPLYFCNYCLQHLGAQGNDARWRSTANKTIRIADPLNYLLPFSLIPARGLVL